MNYFFITGASNGIGKALAELLLSDKKNCVIGISRTCTIHHDNYRHITIDLSHPTSIDNSIFKELNTAEKIVLVNNAGAISEIKHLGNIDNQTIIADYMVNLVSPAVLSNEFVKAYQNSESEKIILNISSGAGKSPTDGWGVYCSSKAGLDMLSRVVALEQVRQKGKMFRIFSVAPGIVDTNMQVQIRNSQKDNFSRLDDFVNYKNNGMLSSPDLVATKLKGILDHPNNYSETLLSVRDK